MPERTTVRLPEGLLARAKKRAAEEGRTLTSLIEEGLESVLAAKPAGAHRIRIPISSGRGGTHPGLDLTKFSDYQEMEDIEYVERMKSLK